MNQGCWAFLRGIPDRFRLHHQAKILREKYVASAFISVHASTLFIVINLVTLI